VLQTSSVRVYLFDIDGTILLSGGAGSRALNRVMLARHQIDDAMSVVRAGGKTDPMIVDEMFRHHLGRGAEPDEIAAILTDYPPLLAEELPRSESFRTMPGALDAVRHLHSLEGVTLGIATGNIEATAQLKLEHAGVWDLFEFGGYADDSAVRAELVAAAIERARSHTGDAVGEDEIVVVGDTPYDIQAARACGVQVIAVPTGSYDRATLDDCEPDWLFETLEELPAWHAAR